MEKTHKIDVVSIRLVEEPPLYSSKELKNPCDVAELFQDFLMPPRSVWQSPR